MPKFRTTTLVQTLPKTNTQPQTIGPAAQQVVDWGLRARWKQELDALHVQLVQTRTCARVVHVPVVRRVEISRKTDGAIYWEYGLGAVLVGLGIWALASPTTFTAPRQSVDGDLVNDGRTGYRLGGVVGGIGLGLLTAGVVDSVRARDNVQYVDAYQVRPGETVACETPQVPLAAHEVALVWGEWTYNKTTDAEGHVALLLPPEVMLAQNDPAATPNGPRERRVNAVVRVDATHALGVDFIAPYASLAARRHQGASDSAPPS